MTRQRTVSTEIVIAVLLALSAACLYRLLLATHVATGSTVATVYGVGLMGGALLGAMSSLGTRRVTVVAVAAIMGIVSGHAWAIGDTADVSTSVVQAVTAAIIQMRIYHVLLVSVVLAAWWLGRVILDRRPSVPAS